jgi:hypothetical protein
MSGAPGIMGDENGIKLWTLICTSKDAREIAYCKQLQSAATQYGKVYFTDFLTQLEQKKNQTIWQMTWHASKNSWVITHFQTPEGADRVTSRITNKLI